MSLYDFNILKNNSLIEAINKQKLQRSSSENIFFPNVISHFFYRKRKIGEFEKISKIQAVKNINNEDLSCSTNYDNKKMIIENYKPKSKNKKILDKIIVYNNVETFTLFKSTIDVIDYHKHLLKFNKNAPTVKKNTNKKINAKNINNHSIKVWLKEGATVIYYSLFTKNPNMFDNFVRLLEGQSEFDYLVSVYNKVYKEMFYRRNLSIDFIDNSLNLQFIKNKNEKSVQINLKRSSSNQLLFSGTRNISKFTTIIPPGSIQSNALSPFVNNEKFSLNSNYNVKFAKETLDSDKTKKNIDMSATKTFINFKEKSNLFKSRNINNNLMVNDENNKFSKTQKNFKIHKKILDVNYLNFELTKNTQNIINNKSVVKIKIENENENKQVNELKKNLQKTII